MLIFKEETKEAEFLEALKTIKGATTGVGFEKDGPATREHKVTVALGQIRGVFYHNQREMTDLTKKYTNLLVSYSLARQEVYCMQKQAIAAAGMYIHILCAKQ